MLQTLRSHGRLLTIAVLLASALLCLHVWLGTPHGHSYKHNLPWFDAFRTAFWSGDLYPRFLPDLWFGFGGADFYFYGPLPFWFASILGGASCPGCDAGQAFSIAGAWLLILSGVSFFVFARRFFDRLWSGISALIYVFLPYHYLVDWYERQAVGEVAVYVFLPLIALATLRLLKEGRGGRLFAVSVAATLFSHLPSAVIIAHLLPVIIVVHALRTKTTSVKVAATASRFVVWGGLGAALAAIYWIPAISLLSSVSPSVLYSEYFDAQNWLFFDGRPEPNPSVSILAKWSLALAITVSVSAWYLLRRSSDSSLKDWILLPCLLTVFLTSAFSAIIWDIWILDRIQFPWRFLIITDLSSALALTVILQRVFIRDGTRPPIATVLLAALSGLMLCIATLNIAPSASSAAIEGQQYRGEFRLTGAPEYIPEGLLHHALSELNERASDNASDADRYVIFFDVMEDRFQRAQDTMHADTQSAVLRARPQGRYHLSVDRSAPGAVRLPVAYWSFWRARDDRGAEVPLEQDPENGLIQLSLPSGQSDIQLYLTQTLPEKIGSTLSSIALLLLILSVVKMSWLNIPTCEKPFATSVV